MLEHKVICLFCRKMSTVVIPEKSAKQYAEWINGQCLVQDIPELSVNDRELLLNGICTTCYPTYNDEDDDVPIDGP